MEKYKDEQGHSGVWRTISGRRVFIRDGEDLSSAMQRSGKFKTKFSPEKVSNLKVQGRKAMARKIDEINKKDKLIDNDMTIKELDDTAQWLYDNDRNEWDKFTDNEIKELAKLSQITNDNPFGRAYDDEVFDEMDKRGLSLNEDIEITDNNFKNNWQNEIKTLEQLESKEKEVKEQYNEYKKLAQENKDKWGTTAIQKNEESYQKTLQNIEDWKNEFKENNDISPMSEWSGRTQDGPSYLQEKAIRYFEEEEERALKNKDMSYGYSEKGLQSLSNKELDDYIKRQEELSNEYNNKYNQSLTYDQRTTRNRQDTIWNKGMKTKYETQLNRANEEKTRREKEVDKYFKREESIEQQEPKTEGFTQHLGMYGGTREYTVDEVKKMEEAGIRPRKESYTGGGWEGVNAHRNLTTSEQAKAITSAMKEKYPGVKISRNSETYSGGSSITFSVMESDKDLYVSDSDIDKMDNFGNLSTSIGFESWAEKNVDGFKKYTNEVYSQNDVRKYAKEVMSDIKKRDNQSVRGDEWYLSDYGKQVMSDLNKEANSYTFDDSDGMVDYFNHGTYMWVNIGKWDKPYQVKPKVAKNKVDNIEAKIERFKKRKNNK